jgi:hypothetical protein
MPQGDIVDNAERTDRFAFQGGSPDFMACLQVQYCHADVIGGFVD